MTDDGAGVGRARTAGRRRRHRPTATSDPTTPLAPATPGRAAAARAAAALRRSGGVGLRRRILLIFTLGSLALSAFLAVTTYGLVRSNLIEQRDSASREAAYATPRSSSSELRGEPGRRPGGQRAARSSSASSDRSIHYRDEWTAGISRFGPRRSPTRLDACSSTASRRG